MTSTTRALKARLRRIARTLRHAPDRALHSLRRQAAQAVLRRSPAPRRILVMCLGNICRSPYAAEALRGVAEGVEVASAGFIGPGRPAPDAARRAAARRGRDLALHRSGVVTAEAVAQADIVIVMDAAQRARIRDEFGRRRGVIVLGDLDPLPIETRAVRDPFEQSDEVFAQVYARIDRCIARLAAELGAVAPHVPPRTGSAA